MSQIRALWMEKTDAWRALPPYMGPPDSTWIKQSVYAKRDHFIETALRKIVALFIVLLFKWKKC